MGEWGWVRGGRWFGLGRADLLRVEPDHVADVDDLVKGRDRRRRAFDGRRDGGCHGGQLARRVAKVTPSDNGCSAGERKVERPPGEGERRDESELCVFKHGPSAS